MKKWFFLKFTRKVEPVTYFVETGFRSLESLLAYTVGSGRKLLMWFPVNLEVCVATYHV